MNSSKSIKWPSATPGRPDLVSCCGFWLHGLTSWSAKPPFPPNIDDGMHRRVGILGNCLASPRPPRRARDLAAPDENVGTRMRGNRLSTARPAPAQFSRGRSPPGPEFPQVLTGVSPAGTGNAHFFAADDSETAFLFHHQGALTATLGASTNCSTVLDVLPPASPVAS